MNGHFEVNHSAYPIGYLNIGFDGKYKVTDMRNLQTLHSHSILKEDAVRIAAKTNKKLRSGKLLPCEIEAYVIRKVAKLAE